MTWPICSVLHPRIDVVRELLVDGRVTDIAIAAIGLEIILLLALRRVLTLHLPDMIGQLVAGTMLLLALRSALRGADYRLTLIFLSASFPAHVYDVARRARRRQATD